MALTYEKKKGTGPVSEFEHEHSAYSLKLLNWTTAKFTVAVEDAAVHSSALHIYIYRGNANFQGPVPTQGALASPQGPLSGLHGTTYVECCHFSLCGSNCQSNLEKPRIVDSVLTKI